MLPSALLARLADAPLWVVAPCGVGFGQAALADWATATGRVVLHDPALASDTPALILPARRGDLDRLPAGWRLGDVLFLEERDLTFSESGWAAPLTHAPAEYRRVSWEQAGGWPEGLALAVELAPSAPQSLVTHPLVRAHLQRLLPGGSLREQLARAAQTPLLLPAMFGPLGLDAGRVMELFDLGLLYADADGYRMPALIRRFLLVPDEDCQREAARTLVERQRVPDALTCLADAQLWSEYLRHLAGWFKASMGEDALRARLRVVPPAYRDRPEFTYLGGMLERVKGEFHRAEQQYAQALAGADEILAQTVSNARGVTLALLGRNDEALVAFDRATRGDARLTAAEALHNRAGLHLQEHRYAEAESDLHEAISAFRASADYTREARTLQLLGTFYYRRGLLPESERTYSDALHLLSTLGGTPTALIRANLAEVLTLSGDLRRAERELQLAAREAGGSDARAWGWTQVNAALLRLGHGDDAGAEEHLNAVLLAGNQERPLVAKAHLLLARVRRARGDMDGARLALQSAMPMGLRAALELALLDGTGLDAVIEQARREEARYELAVALLNSDREEHLREALTLIRAHRYLALLESPAHAQKLIGLSEHDAALRELFPVHLRLLGQFQVRFLGRTFSLTDFPTRKSAALFVAVALSERPQSREALAERFWPDAKNPAGSLQTAVYHLRGALGAPVVRNERGLLSLAFPVQTDLWDLADAARDALTLEPGEALPLLAEALAGAGPYLPEFTEEFEEDRAAAEEDVQRLRRELARLAPPGSDAEREALRALITADPYDLGSRARLAAWHDARGESDAAGAERRRLAEIEKELQA